LFGARAHVTQTRPMARGRHAEPQHGYRPPTGRCAFLLAAALLVPVALLAHPAGAGAAPAAATGITGGDAAVFVASWEELQQLAASAQPSSSLTIQLSGTIVVPPGATAVFVERLAGSAIRLQGPARLRCDDGDEPLGPVLQLSGTGARFELEGLEFSGCRRTAASFQLNDDSAAAEVRGRGAKQYVPNL
jgi:hypothetical protein